MNFFRSFPNRLRNTLAISTREGLHADIFFRVNIFDAAFVTAALQHLGASSFFLSWMRICGMLGTCMQLLGVWLAERTGRHRRLCVFLAGLPRVLAPLAILCFLMEDKQMALWLYIAILGVVNALQQSAANIWLSWMAALVPLRIRGRFFSARSRMILIPGVLCGFLVCWWLDAAKVGQGPCDLNTTFMILIGLSSAIGILGLPVLARQEPPPPHSSGGVPTSSLREAFANRNFLCVCLLGAWFMAGAGFGSVFWVPFMINDLHWSMREIMLYEIIATAARFSTFILWGRLIDRFGNKASMLIVILSGFLNPLPWLFASADLCWFILLEAFTAGASWCGHACITSNFVNALVAEKDRRLFNAIYNTACALAMIGTIILSEFFMLHLDGRPVMILGRLFAPEQVLFALSSIGRLSALIPLCLVRDVHGKGIRRMMGSLLTNSFWPRKESGK